MSATLARMLSCLAVVPALLIATPARSHEPSPVVSDYDVFVDPPTAFAFIKLPNGWKFIGKLDADQLNHLPPGTLTSLLPPDDDAPARLADESTRPAARTKKSRG